MMYLMDFTAFNGKQFRAVLVPKNEVSPNFPDSEPAKVSLIEFYDRQYKHTPDGQFIARYDILTFMQQYPAASGLNLYGGVESWRISAKDRLLVQDLIVSLDKQIT